MMAVVPEGEPAPHPGLGDGDGMGMGMGWGWGGCSEHTVSPTPVLPGGLCDRSEAHPLGQPLIPLPQDPAPSLHRTHGAALSQASQTPPQPQERGSSNQPPKCFRAHRCVVGRPGAVPAAEPGATAVSPTLRPSDTAPHPAWGWSHVVYISRDASGVNQCKHGEGNFFYLVE